jgi:hypothetical protein
MKLFITSKIYDTDKKTAAEIEKAVQNDLDQYIGKNKVIFKLYIKNNKATLSFNRFINYSTFYIDPKESIIDADAYMITGENFNGFNMPVQFPKVPFGYTYSMEQTDFINAYVKSTKLLNGDRISNMSLNIKEEEIILKIKTK